MMTKWKLKTYWHRKNEKLKAKNVDIPKIQI